MFKMNPGLLVSSCERVLTCYEKFFYFNFKLTFFDFIFNNRWGTLEIQTTQIYWFVSQFTNQAEKTQLCNKLFVKDQKVNEISTFNKYIVSTIDYYKILC